jgi:hypothetical protein
VTSVDESGDESVASDQAGPQTAFPASAPNTAPAFKAGGTSTYAAATGTFTIVLPYTENIDAATVTATGSEYTAGMSEASGVSPRR